MILLSSWECAGKRVVDDDNGKGRINFLEKT
jgi:hypothetical protein